MPKGVYIRTEEHRRKLSLAHSGMKYSEERNNKISKRMMGNKNNLGKHWKIKDTSRMGHSAWNKNLKMPLAFGLKISKRQIGKKREPHSEITKKKISLALKGKKRKPLTEEHKKKIHLAHKGRTPKNINLIAGWNKNRKCLQLSGKNHYNYKGGITPLNHLIRNSLEYKQWRESIFRRDNFKCQMIGVGCSKLNPHKLEANHIKLFSKYPELRFDKNNGITLCRDCHKEIRGREWRFENLFKIILDNRIVLNY